MDKYNIKDSRNENLLIITQVVDENDPILVFFIDWIKEFSKYYNKVLVICQKKGRFNLPNNVKVFSLGKENNYKRYRRLFEFYRLIWKLRHEYNNVFVHMIPIYVLLGALLWKLINKKIYLWYAHGLLNKSVRLSLPLIQNIFTPNKGGCNLNNSKVIITGHGINTKLFRFNKNKVYSNNITKALVVGRITKIKNIETIIKAVAKFNQDNKNNKIILNIIGDCYFNDNKYKTDLVNLVNKLKIRKYIKFLGWISHKSLTNYYKNADLLISACLTSSFDKNILEAMACGVPVITSNKSFKGVLPDEFIFKEKDANDLLLKINKFIELPNHIKSRLSHNLIKYINYNHSLKYLIKKINVKIL